MPRKPRTRSQGTDGHEKICVLTGINDAGDIFYEIAGRGGLDEAAARELLADKLAVGAIISTDRAHVYRRVLPALGVGAHIASKREEHAINRVNSLHSQMRHFIGRFGVSPRDASRTTSPGSSGHGASRSAGARTSSPSS